MSHEISAAIALHLPTIKEIMHMGGSAIIASTQPAELSSPIAHVDGTPYTHGAVERFQRQADEVIGPDRGRKLVHYTPKLVASVSNPKAPGRVAYGVRIHFADFKLSAPFLPNGPALPRRPDLLMPTRYEIGYSDDPDDVFGLGMDLVKAGELEGPDESGRHVERAAAALFQIMEGIRQNGYLINPAPNRGGGEAA